MPNQQIKLYWQAYEKKFGKIPLETFCLRYFPWSFWEPAKKRLDILLKCVNKNQKILDAGCGNGWASLFLSRKNFKVTSVDLSLKAIRRLKNLSNITGIKFTLVKADLLQLPFANKKFDIIFSFDVLEHIFELDKTIKELKRVLIKEGLLIVSLPNKWGSFSLLHDVLIERLLRKASKKGFEEKHVGLRSIIGWRHYFENNGFRIMQINNIEYLAPLFAFVNRKWFRIIVNLDVMISRWLPKFFSSEWLIIIKKKA